MFFYLLACSTTEDVSDPKLDLEPEVEPEFVECAQQGVISAETSHGCLWGTELADSEAFLGVPYAEAPVDELRWKRPQSVAAWSEPRDASLPSESCSQNIGGVLYGSEDCLYLNVMRPKGTTPEDKLPILFYTHGGSYLYGAGVEDVYIQNPALAKEAIVVTHNYRLGVWGFLAHPELTQEDAGLYGGSGSSGNQGLFDSLMALNWVVENAEALGGDPEQLMIFGESAGGLTTCALLASELASGLFSSALIQSSGCMWLNRPLNTPGFDGESAEDQGARIAEQLACNSTDSLSCMREASPAELSVAAFEEAQFFPNVDQVFIDAPLGELFFNGDFNQVPIVAGINENEGSLFVHEEGIDSQEELDLYLESWAAYAGVSDVSVLKSIYSFDNYQDYQLAFDHFYGDAFFGCPLKFFMDSTSLYTPTYGYFFTHVPSWNEYYDQDGWGAYHSAELSFVFGSFLDYLTAEEVLLSERMRESWISVARGEIFVDGLSEWPSFSEQGSSYEDGGQWLEWGSTSSTVLEGVNKAECDFLASQWF